MPQTFTGAVQWRYGRLDSVFEGWMIESSLYVLDLPEAEESTEVRRLDFEVVPPEELDETAYLRGYALYYVVCEGTSGGACWRQILWSRWRPNLKPGCGRRGPVAPYFAGSWPVARANHARRERRWAATLETDRR